MRNLVYLGLFAGGIFGCSAPDEALFKSCEAELDTPAKINDVDKRIRRIAKNWDFKIFEKDRASMALLTQGKSAFYIEVLAENNDPLLWVTNAGAGDLVALVVTRSKHVSEVALTRLTNEVLAELAELGLSFDCAP